MRIQSPEKSTSACKTSGDGRAYSWPWCMEKENHHQRDMEKIPKALSITSGSGAKSFMAPTISATSKAVAASALTRKKVLGECNNDLPQEQLHHHPIPSSPSEMAHNKPVFNRF